MSRFALLQRVRNTMASETNPYRDGWYLRTITRPQGRMNPGRKAVVLHDDGVETETCPENLAPIESEEATVESLIGDLAIERRWTDEAREEIARLRTVVDAATQMRDACPMDWTHGECDGSQCEMVCCALDALGEEAGE